MQLKGIVSLLVLTVVGLNEPCHAKNRTASEALCDRAAQNRNPVLYYKFYPSGPFIWRIEQNKTDWRLRAVTSIGRHDEIDELENSQDAPLFHEPILASAVTLRSFPPAHADFLLAVSLQDGLQVIQLRSAAGHPWILYGLDRRVPGSEFLRDFQSFSFSEDGHHLVVLSQVGDGRSRQDIQVFDISDMMDTGKMIAIVQPAKEFPVRQNLVLPGRPDLHFSHVEMSWDNQRLLLTTSSGQKYVYILADQLLEQASEQESLEFRTRH